MSANSGDQGIIIESEPHKKVCDDIITFQGLTNKRSSISLLVCKKKKIIVV